MEQSNKEKKNKQIGAIVSIGSHVLIILLFLFMVAWRAPDPPLPEYGIELNFGLDEAGSGDVQPEPNTQPSEAESEEEAKPDGKEVPIEEEVEQPQETETPVEEVTPVTTEQESPDVVEQETEKKVEEPVEKEEEVKEEAPKLPPVLYPNNKTGSGGKDGDANEAQNANQGDKTGAVGDQGDKEGNVDSRALYGNAGGGGGPELNMNGWKWDSEPKVNDTSDESGTIILRIVIDGKGIVQTVTTEPGTTINPLVVNKYKEAVRKITFSPFSGTVVTSTATGTITFKVKAK